MIDLNQLKHTRFYQDALEQGRQQMKFEMVPRLLNRGFSIKEIAEILELDFETVREVARQF